MGPKLNGFLDSPRFSQVRAGCENRTVPSAWIAIDEPMVALTGRSVHTVKFKNKSIKEGFRIWTPDFNYGYIYSWCWHSLVERPEVLVSTDLVLSILSQDTPDELRIGNKLQASLLASVPLIILLSSDCRRHYRRCLEACGMKKQGSGVSSNSFDSREGTLVSPAVTGPIATKIGLVEHRKLDLFRS